MPFITLTSDFGSDSPYVAQMKGVILSLAPQVGIVDVTHAIAPQDVFAGALALVDVARWFPPATIHVAVVDPGVGTTRRLVAVRAGEHWFLTPDNGLLTGVLRASPTSEIFAIENRAWFLSRVSHTFHGRDILAPVAAHLSLGTPGESLGPRVDRLVELDWPQPHVAGETLVGQIIASDTFGNLITNITERDVADFCAAGDIVVQFGNRSLPGLARTYGETVAGEIIALFGSGGRLEIAAVNGNAAQQLNLTHGHQVVLRRC